jgi:YD repeat-containing protein
MKKQSFFLGWFWLAVAVPLLLLPQLAQAKPIGTENPFTCCVTCGTCPTWQVQLAPGIVQLSLTEGNLSESLDLSRTLSSTGPTLSFSAAYNSYNADGSRAQVDTLMGYGWTHSYNIFLFSQFGSMFRYDGRGRVSRYRLVPGGFLADPGYFETLVKNNDGTFTLTQKDKTTFTFASIPNTSFLVEGPVWRLTSIVDRNGNTTTLTYTNGDLTSVTDTYGRSITLTYNSQRKLEAIADPAGRLTTFQYDSTGRQLTKITDPIGNTIQYSYNFLYQLTGKVDRMGGHSPSCT